MLRTSRLQPKRVWTWTASGQTPTALIAWIYVMGFLLSFLGFTQVGGPIFGDPFHSHKIWFQVPPSELFSLQRAMMLTQVLWLVWLWTKFHQARSFRKRIPWQQYLFYGGLALVLMGQQQVLYKMSVQIPHYELIPFPEYTGGIPDPTPDEPEPIPLGR